MALRTSSSACVVSTISPLRTPRERAWPRPMMFNPAPAGSAFRSPTTAQTLDVPISKPTIMDESSNIFPPGVSGVDGPGCGGRRHDGFHPTDRHVVGNRQIERRHRFVHALSQIVNFAPTPQLLLQIVQTESNFAALTRRDDNNSRQ